MLNLIQWYVSKIMRWCGSILHLRFFLLNFSDKWLALYQTEDFLNSWSGGMTRNSRLIDVCLLYKVKRRSVDVKERKVIADWGSRKGNSLSCVWKRNEVLIKFTIKSSYMLVLKGLTQGLHKLRVSASSASCWFKSLYYLDRLAEPLEG